jgi:8-amino-7-oxononanoate synthase
MKSATPNSSWPERLQHRVLQRLEELQAAGQYRKLQPPSGIDLSSNDYLALSTHPALKACMSEAVQQEGCGSTGSRLLRGERDVFAELERRFASFKGTAAALYFGSGYSANLGALTALLQEGDVVFSDRCNHASLIDALRLSRARRVVYPHCDLPALKTMLQAEHGAGQKFVVTESLFSMDGDMAPLADYAELCRLTDTALIVDEAHAVGIYGARGSGLIEETGAGVFLSINPAGKALGVCGAFVSGPARAIDYIVQHARSFIFSTAPPPAVAAPLNAALTIIEREPERRARLLELAGWLRRQLTAAGIPIPEGKSQIIPVVLGSNERAVATAAALRENGFDVRAIRPPTVPEGSARLRISVNVNLDENLLSRFAAALGEAIGRSASVG